MPIHKPTRKPRPIWDLALDEVANYPTLTGAIAAPVTLTALPSVATPVGMASLLKGPPSDVAGEVIAILRENLVALRDSWTEQARACQVQAAHLNEYLEALDHAVAVNLPGVGGRLTGGGQMFTVTAPRPHIEVARGTDVRAWMSDERFTQFVRVKHEPDKVALGNAAALGQLLPVGVSVVPGEPGLKASPVG